MNTKTLDSIYPIVIMEDRYTGAYSGGRWIAIAKADELTGKVTRLALCFKDGPSGGDPIALRFWDDAPGWLAVGNTPNEARDALLHKYGLPPGDPTF